MRKTFILLLTVFMMVSFVACGQAASDGLKQGIEDAMGDSSNVEQAVAQEKDASAETEPETAESELEAIAEPGMETLPADEMQKLEKESAEIGNPLMDAEVIVSDVMNGTKTEKLGEWAEIQVKKEVLKGITQEQFSEFCNEVVADSGYNWFTLSCEDGTGIQFAGSTSYVSTYGTLDNEGCIIESMGTIMVQEDGTYCYTESE